MQGDTAHLLGLALMKEVRTPDMMRALLAACGLYVMKDRVSRLEGALGDMPGVTPFPSQANFVLARIEGRNARDVRDALRQRGIFVRYFATPPVDDCIRITAGTPEQFFVQWKDEAPGAAASAVAAAGGECVVGSRDSHHHRPAPGLG